MRRRGWRPATTGTIESYERAVCGLTMRVWRVLGAVRWSGRFSTYSQRQAYSAEELVDVLEGQALRLLEREAEKLQPDRGAP